MAARAWLFGLVLAVPLLGFLVASGIQPDPDSGPIAGFAFLRRSSLVAAAAGLALIAVIALAGRAAQSDRNLLLSIFRPGLYITAIAITGLIVVHGVLAIMTVYLGETAMTGRAHGFILLAIAVGAITGVAAVAKSAFGLVQKAETSAVGIAVTDKDAPDLWQKTDAVARTLGALRPDHIVIGLDPWFFVTEATVSTLNGRLTGRTLFCSLPLARILTVDEFSAIIGHELGHFRGEDTKFSEGFYPIYRGTTTAIESLQAAGGEGVRAVALLPAIAMFGFFLERFAVAERLHSRLREFLADQAGAEATSDQIMATALVKVHAFAGIWSGVQDAAMAALMRGKIYGNISAMFVQAVTDNAKPAALEGLADSHTSHPTDSHPPLAARLASLKVDLAAVAGASLEVNPASSAATLFPDPDAQEDSLSEAYKHLLARGLGIDPRDPSTVQSPREVGRSTRSPTDPDYIICARCGSEQWKGYTRCEKCGIGL